MRIIPGICAHYNYLETLATEKCLNKRTEVSIFSLRFLRIFFRVLFNIIEVSNRQGIRKEVRKALFFLLSFNISRIRYTQKVIFLVLTCQSLHFQSRSDKRRSGDEQPIAYEHSDDYRPKPYYYSGQLEYEISKRVRLPRKLERERAKAELDSERLSEKLDEKARRKLTEKSRRNNNSIRRNGSQVKSRSGH